MPRLFPTLILVVSVGLLPLGCTGSGDTGPTDPDPAPDVEPDPEPEAAALAPSTKNQLLWKRYRAFEQGLGEALNLASGQLCKELGRYDCIERVHLVALGGNDPFLQGMHEPMSAPTATTPVAVERLVLSACEAAVVADAGRPVPLIFLDLDLSEGAGPIDLQDEATALAVDDTITSLFRRLHARDPLPEERALVKKIVTEQDEGEPPLTARELGVLACYAIGTTTKAVFH